MTIRYSNRLPTAVLGWFLATCASAAWATTSLSTQAPADQSPFADRVTVPLSNPSRPALIDVSLVKGSITVRGTNRKDVLVTAHPEADRPGRRVDADATGMHRLPQTAGFRISEEANLVKMSSDNPNRSITFEIEAPARTNLRLSTVNGGEILIENIDGDLDVSGPSAS